ncbi:hypothetical protein SAMN05421813_12841 [Daejeonella rubra]|uniref:Uncharacterized protein n=1 Tax=Daejeonella rubra TaxID=990371 RepID=A0A1G9X497_9SPHI|nr:hypothetical protein [Daejeonella rubra]SDM91286.1 hypothetical protein SAMN05421813_12841 [Daejeonella rubra]
MKTFIYISIALTILYLIAREYFAYKAKLAEKITEEQRIRDEEQFKLDELEQERIMAGRNIDELYAELDAKELEDLTDNERKVLLAITLWYEGNRRLMNEENPYCSRKTTKPDAIEGERNVDEILNGRHISIRRTE